MKSKILPQRPRKWPLDLEDLRRVSDEVCHSFLVEIVTKSLHRGGVVQFVNSSTELNVNNAFIRNFQKFAFPILITNFSHFEQLKKKT